MFVDFHQAEDLVDGIWIEPLADDLVFSETFFDLFEDGVDFFVAHAQLFFVGLAVKEFGRGRFFDQFVGEAEVGGQFVDFFFVEIADYFDVGGEISVFGAVADHGFRFVGSADDEGFSGVGEIVEDIHAYAGLGVHLGEGVGGPGESEEIREIAVDVDDVIVDFKKFAEFFGVALVFFIRNAFFRHY